jgi:RNA-directed DNA polymerase
MWRAIRRAFLGGGREGFELEDLAARLEMTPEQLRALRPAYSLFEIPRRSGGSRTIHAPDDALKEIQRRILHRVLHGLRAHPAVHGFEEGRSIVTNALPHVGKAVVIALDIRDFFPTTSAQRVTRYLRRVGWSKAAAAEMVRLCTWQGGLPQGAPASPRLSNLVNYHLDARLAGLAASMGATYTRYADDITYSLAEDSRQTVAALIGATRRIVREEGGYALHPDKLTVRRRHQRQEVTGLVVNERIHLPRETRRWLRAVEHRLRTGGQCSLSEAELDGWLALTRMVHEQPRDAVEPER